MAFFRSSTLLSVALCLSSTWAATVPESFLLSVRSVRPVTARNSPSRDRTCVVESHNDGTTDDSEFVTKALDDCNDGGHIIFSKDQSYVLGEPLDMTALQHIDLDIQGNIKFTNDLEYWRNNTFDLSYQNSTSFFKLGGSDVNVYGGGAIDGQGQAWWDHYAKNKQDKRPVLFATVGLDGGTISDLSLNSPPFWTNFVANSTDVVFTNISIYAVSNNENFEKNTDGTFIRLIHISSAY